MPAPLCLGRGPALSEALRFVGFLIPENRKASLCAGQRDESRVVSAELGRQGSSFAVSLALIKVHDSLDWTTRWAWLEYHPLRQVDHQPASFVGCGLRHLGVNDFSPRTDYDSNGTLRFEFLDLFLLRLRERVPRHKLWWGAARRRLLVLGSNCLIGKASYQPQK